MAYLETDARIKVKENTILTTFVSITKEFDTKL